MERKSFPTERTRARFPAKRTRSPAKRTRRARAAERTSFPKAIKMVLNTLGTGESFSISDLSKQANINRRTVEKALEILEITQKYFQEKKLEITPLKHAKIVQLSERFGLLNLPEELQKLIIKTTYYPSPSREEEILVFAHRQEAFSPETAIKIENSTLVKKLLKQGQFHGTRDGKLYLSDEGRIIAAGALKLYPELNTL